MLSHKFIFVFSVVFVLGFVGIQADQQSYEDARCMCTCTIVNGTLKYKKSIVSPVPPNNNCDAVIVAPAGDSKKASEELCPRCECIYESRNTGIIKVVVAIVIWIISVLVIYMFFLLCLDPLLNKRAKSSYVEHTNEEDDTTSVAAAGGSGSHPMGVRSSGASGVGGNVLNRVGVQQDKWKRQVKEQRKNIYDRHTMLN